MQRFGSGDVIVQLALYPGELVAVIADDNNDAFPVTVTYSGTLTVGPVAGPPDRPPRWDRRRAAPDGSR